MRNNQKGFSVIEIVAASAVLMLLVTVGILVFQAQQNRTLSADQINKKFNCNRITFDARETDVFCTNPKFYNDPESITRDDYYMYYHCEARLSSAPPEESLKTQDPGFYNAYYDCKDESRLETKRQEFVRFLVQTKEAHQ